MYFIPDVKGFALLWGKVFIISEAQDCFFLTKDKRGGKIVLNQHKKEIYNESFTCKRKSA